MTTTTTTTPVSTASANVAPEMSAADKRKALKRCETVISKGQAAFLAIAPAVLEIAEERLWKVASIDGKPCESMGQYAETKWDMNQSDVSRMKKAAMLLANLQKAGVDTMPRNLHVCNQLADLSPERQIEAWGKVLKSGKKATAATVKGIVDEMFGEKTVKEETVVVELHGPRDIDSIINGLKSFEDGLAEIQLQEEERATLLQRLDEAEQLIAEIRAKLG